MNRRRKSELRVSALQIAYQIMEGFNSVWGITDAFSGDDLDEVLSVLQGETQRAYERWQDAKDKLYTHAASRAAEPGEPSGVESRQ